MLTLAQRVGYGFDHMDGWGWGGAIFMVLMAALFVALLVWFIVTVAGRRGDTGVSPGLSSSRARTLLDERYAKGEIERDEYLQRKEDLGG